MNILTENTALSVYWPRQITNTITRCSQGTLHYTCCRAAECNFGSFLEALGVTPNTNNIPTVLHHHRQSRYRVKLKKLKPSSHVLWACFTFRYLTTHATNISDLSITVCVAGYMGDTETTIRHGQWRKIELRGCQNLTPVSSWTLPALETAQSRNCLLVRLVPKKIWRYRQGVA